MTMQQQARGTTTTSNDVRYIHLKAIDVRCASLYKELQIVLRLASEKECKSGIFNNVRLLHWDCNIYVKSSSSATLTIQELKSLGRVRVVAAFNTGINLGEFRDGSKPERNDETAKTSVTFSVGVPRKVSEVAQLLAYEAVVALGTKVSMLEKIEKICQVCELPMELGVAISEIEPHAKAAAAGIQIVFQRFQKMASCHKELISFMDNVVDLIPTVKHILHHVTDQESQAAIQNFFNFVKEVAENLKEYASKGSLAFLKNWFKPKTDDVRQFKDDLERLTRALDLSVQGNILTHTVAIREHQLSDAELKSLKRLWPPENSAFDPSRGCLPGTRENVIKETTQWASTAGHGQQLYWIHGVAGCGKSSVAASVAEALERQGILSGSFFCKRDIHERKSAKRLIHSLAYVLAVRLMPYRNALLRILKDNQLVVYEPLSSQFNTILAIPLSEMSQEAAKGQTVIIIIDALDECDECETISYYLVNLVLAVPWLRFIITSRPVPQIRTNLLQHQKLLESCDLFAATTDADILCFAQEQFKSNTRLPKDKPGQIEALVKRSSRHFIWISTVLKHVSVAAFGRSKLLEQIIDLDYQVLSYEGNLDTVYLRVLGDAAKGYVDGEYAVKIILGLIFIISQNRPLPSHAIHTFLPSNLGAEEHELEDILEQLGSVLYKDPQTGAIRAYHPSFLDFIGRKERSGCFWTPEVELDTHMASKCLDIMLGVGGLRFNICELETSLLQNNDVEDLCARVARNITPQLQYSCLYWYNHLFRTQKGEQSTEQMLQTLHDFLLQTSSLYWLEALSVMSEMKSAVMVLQDLQDVLKRLKADEELISTASDLYRFTMAFQEPMTISAPHIYISALLWTPLKSMVASRCYKSFNSQHCIVKGVNEHWSANLHTMAIDAAANCVAYAPDGRHIVSGCTDKRIHILDAQTGTHTRPPLEGHQGSINSVAYSPDGRHIISGSRDKTVLIWDAETGAQVGTSLKGHQGWVCSVAYSPDGRHIASGSDDKTLRIWDSQTGIEVRPPFEGHEGCISSVAYSPDGRRIVSGSFDYTVRVWDTQSRKVYPPLKGHQNWIRSVVYSPDGRHIVSGSDDKTVRIWNAQVGGQPSRVLKGHQRPVSSVAYSPDGRCIVSGSWDNTVRIWDAQTGTQVGQLLGGHTDPVCCVAYSPDGFHIISTSWERTMCIWDSRSAIQDRQLLWGHKSTVCTVAFSPDGHQIVSGSWDNTMCLWDALKGTQVGLPLRGHQGSVFSVAYSPDGSQIASGSEDKTVRIWDAQTGVQIGPPLEGHQGSIFSVAYSLDGDCIVSGSEDRTIRIWDARIGIQFGTPLEGHQGYVLSVAYSPDEQHIISGSQDGTVRIWDAQTGAQIGLPLKCTKGRIYSVSCSPDGRYIVCGSSDKIIRIWDTRTGIQVGLPLTGHQGSVRSVSYSPDGQYIVSGSEDKTVRIWDTQTGAQVGRPLEGHQGSVFSVTYWLYGRYIISGSEDRTMRIWETKSVVQTSGLNRARDGRQAYSTNIDRFMWINESAIEVERSSTAYSEYPSNVPNDGWIRTLSGGLFLWVPHEYREGICDMSLDCFPRYAPGHPVRIDWQKICRGKTWTAVKIGKNK
ncbi:WD40 repeat-like protein [Fomitiporia mediterranea MF3/22]|uniref:WD40 repeat-like protein n=1 Tax=Fomitiporia mediterranea (strain MF3/22) TaxID=694068 RepID=UPI00044096FC|nr:WD40 repeat-like protein [Fomitiporia mediterranea MF3/22]EJD02398.1 WD40 repeat-like protein [Fomitiporia mediterranea MF3/22]